MKRRQFLKLGGAALASLGLPLALLKEHPYSIPVGYIREVQQYSISEDEAPWRYDAVGVAPDGAEAQFCVELDDDPYPEARREAARFAIGHRFKMDGLTAVKPGNGRYFKLVLPRIAERARYV